LRAVFVAACVAGPAEAVHHSHARVVDHELGNRDTTLTREVLQAACNVDGGQQDEMLAKLRQCAHALEELAERTTQGHRASKSANDEYVKHFGRVMGIVARLQDVKRLNDVFAGDQMEAMNFLLAEARKVESEIGGLVVQESAGSGASAVAKNAKWVSSSDVATNQGSKQQLHGKRASGSKKVSGSQGVPDKESTEHGPAMSADELAADEQLMAKALSEGDHSTALDEGELDSGG